MAVSTTPPFVKSLYFLKYASMCQIDYEMFVRMLTVHCDQNNSYEIAINGFQVRNINEIRNVIFGLGQCLFKQGSPKNLWISSSTQLGEHPNFGLNVEEVSHIGDQKLRFLFRLYF